jgi:NAD+ diphosphatase
MDAETDFSFAGSALDRAAGRRGDPAALAALLAAGTVLALWRGRPLLRGGAGLCWLPPSHPALAAAPPPVFLGLDAGTARFAQDLSAWMPADGGTEGPAGPADDRPLPHPELPADAAFVELRRVMTALPPREGELAATAKAVVEWHRTHGFCAVCGTGSRPVEGGWQRQCPACGARHFPRTDPVVIMLVTHGERALLGRSPGWPEGMYSCLAGFVEPGETIEAAVRREVAEEAGIGIGAVRYLASQPWPFPSSLMIGCLAEALGDSLTIDPAEIEDARWVARDEMVAVIAGTHPAIRPPRRGAIARALVAGWLADRLR